jgi:hypothetical protein
MIVALRTAERSGHLQSISLLSKGICVQDFNVGQVARDGRRKYSSGQFVLRRQVQPEKNNLLYFTRSISN